jgi:hypothetical protein
MSRDRGQAVVLMLAVVVVAVLTAVAAGEMGHRIVVRARARAAADAAALAGATGGQAAAERLAAANGATLVSFLRDGGDVAVVVSLGGESATARASDEP